MGYGREKELWEPTVLVGTALCTGLTHASAGAAQPQGPQGLQQEQPTPGAGSGRLLPIFDAALYCPPALRDAAGPSGSPEMRRDPAFAPPQAHGPAKQVLPPPGFKQPQVCDAVALWSALAAGQGWKLPDSFLPQPHISECNLQA